MSDDSVKKSAEKLAKNLRVLSKAKFTKSREIRDRFKFMDYKDANISIFDEADYYLFKAIELDKEILKGYHLTDEDAEMLLKYYNLALYLEAYSLATNKYQENRKGYVKTYLRICDWDDYIEYVYLIKSYPKFLYSDIPFQVLLTNANCYIMWLEGTESNLLPFGDKLSTKFWEDKEYDNYLSFSLDSD